MKSLTNSQRDEIYRAIRSHLANAWPRSQREEFSWNLGPVSTALPRFRVCRLSPPDAEDPWVYASIGAWEAADSGEMLEFLVVSPVETPRHVETLAMVAHYRASNPKAVELGGVLEIGHPWLENARADRLLVSLPYPYGPALELCPTDFGVVRYLWLLPITKQEHDFVEKHGVEALECRFDEENIDAVNPKRQSVVPSARPQDGAQT